MKIKIAKFLCFAYSGFVNVKNKWDFQLKKILKTNEFVIHLYSTGKIFKENFDFMPMFASFNKYFDTINEHLYKKLSAEDRDLLVIWFLKRFGNIDTVSEEDAKYIKNLFEYAKGVYRKRKSVDEFMEFTVANKTVKFISPSFIDAPANTIQETIGNYYEVVHAFLMTEYKQENFEPKDGETILDVGAFTGDTAVAFRALYPKSPIYSFECNEKYFGYLEKNIKVNNFSEIYPIIAFLHSKSGEIKEDISSDARLIKTISLDDFAEENKLNNIGMIKFDIEGGEQEALKGAYKIIKEQKPILAIPIYHLKDDVAKIPKWLTQLGEQMEFKLKWTERIAWGVDCVLFVKFKKDSSEN